MSGSAQPRVAVVGGGLAGLAAATELAESGAGVDLFEARRQLGGRAASFRDAESGESIDHCQHVAMGCCLEFTDFCRRTGVASLFQTYDTLHFFSPAGRRYDLRGASWLPAPLHLAPALLRLGYLSLGERLAVARGLLQLARSSTPRGRQEPTIGDWLRAHGQSPQAIDRFWSVVLVSALAESIERVALSAARKVFVEGFLSSRRAYQINVPRVPLAELYERIAVTLGQRGVRLHLSAPVAQVEGGTGRVSGLRLRDGSHHEFDYVIVALPWRRVGGLFSGPLADALSGLRVAAQLESSPITSIHLWYDRAIVELPHAVLVDRLGQWVFRRNGGPPAGQRDREEHYYQVVISASRGLRDQPRETIVQQVQRELAEIWPAAAQARLLRWRVVTEPDAVFAPLPGSDRHRPAQQTEIGNLLLAGDWTRTGWPATMESAVRSGYLAARAVSRSRQ